MENTDRGDNGIEKINEIKRVKSNPKCLDCQTPIFSNTIYIIYISFGYIKRSMVIFFCVQVELSPVYAQREATFIEVVVDIIEQTGGLVYLVGTALRIWSKNWGHWPVPVWRKNDLEDFWLKHGTEYS